MDTPNFSVTYGGDDIIANHEIRWEFTGLKPREVAKAVTNTLNEFLPQLKALRLATPTEELASQMRIACWKRMPPQVGLAQIGLKIGYADTAAVENYLGTTR